jgi:two-component system, sensor histidine kinase and response regulator
MDSTIVGSYNYPVAALAVCISVLASYTALDLAERITASYGMVRRQVWLICGGVVLGIGIWSMHFTAMWAFRIPVPVEYYWPLVLLSFLEVVVASIIALAVVSRKTLGMRAAMAGSLLQGAGISGLHYMSMASMRMPAMCHYSPPIVGLSVLVAVAGSLLSLWLTFLFGNRPTGWKLRKIASAVVMGAAISLMHFTGMAAASFTTDNTPPDFTDAVRITLLGIAGIIAVTVIVLFGTVITALVDRLQEKSEQLSKLFEKLPQPVTVMDENGRALRVNPEFTRVFGYTSEETVGRQLSELIATGGDLGLDLDRDADLAPEHQQGELEAVRHRKDCGQLHVLVVSVTVSLPGRRKEIWTIYRDITARKRAEASLQAVSSRLLEVQEAERRHLARELHDEVGQLLTGLRLLLKLDGDASIDTIKGRSDQALSIVDDLLGTVRRLSFDLRPADLDQFGLLPALLGLFERYTSQSDILVDFKHRDVDRRFESKVETAAYRVVQQALTNTAQHAGVVGVTVRLWAEANKLHLQVEDRGRGFDPETVTKVTRSSGLFGMSERTSLVGGRMTIDSTPGEGTTITAELPLNDTSTQ